MAMTITITDNGVLESIQKLIERAQDFSEPLKEIGVVMLESTNRRFDTGTAPDGSKWPANSPVTLARKSAGKGPLIGESRVLSTTINIKLQGDDTVSIGSPWEYANMQQYGGRKAAFPHLWGDIPARPFIGVPQRPTNKPSRR